MYNCLENHNLSDMLLNWSDIASNPRTGVIYQSNKISFWDIFNIFIHDLDDEIKT